LRGEDIFEAISLMASDGSGEIQDVTRSPWEVYQPTFTPDGRHILFGSREGGLVSAIWIMNLHGTNKRRLTNAPIEAAGPDASPDGRHVVFYSRQNTPRPGHVFVMNANGTGVKQLTPEELISNFPTYSPDGRKIAFEGDSPVSANIFTMNADGSDITKITSNLVELDNCGGNCVIADWGAEPEE
jgi:Tol biopolymer transport system component